MPKLALDETLLDGLDSHDRAELLQSLQTIEKVYDENPLAAYDPHPKQKQFHAAKTRIKAFIGGARSGKSTGGIADDLIQALDADVLPRHLQAYKRWTPPFRCRIFTPGFGHTFEEVKQKIQELVPPSALLGGDWEDAYLKSERLLRFANGSMFDFMSYDQDLSLLRSVRRHRIHYDEEPPEPIRKASRARLIDYGGDEVFTFTPDMGLSWTADAIYDRRDQPQITVVQCGMRDNPYLSPKEIEANLEGLTDEERRVVEKGEYVALGGIFYPEFRDTFHVLREEFDALKDRITGQEIVVGIDPGYNTTAAIWLGFDTDNAAVAFDELYCHKRVPAQIAEEIHERNRTWELDGDEITYVIDPSARNRATVNAEQVEAEFARAEIFCQSGQNARDAGILEVKRRLQQGELQVAERCRTLRWEFPRYRRDPQSADEWAAIKVDDHGLDALRYGVMARVWETAEVKKKKRRTASFEYEPAYRPRARPAPPLGSFY